ncbi:MAG: phospholipase A [Pseudomonadota bacterium]
MSSSRFLLAVVGQSAWFLGAPVAFADDACLLREARTASPDTTLKELRLRCENSDPGPPPSELSETRVVASTDFEAGAIRQRIGAEDQIEASPFKLTPHAPNYIAYSLMDEANQAPFAPLVGTPEPIEDHEAVFQISFKAPIAQNIFATDLDVYFAYTSKAWWQVANDDLSSPFRETNYQPELFIRSDQRRSIFGIPLEGWSLGYAHESNGREQALSRSWDRIEARAAFQLVNDISLFARTWYRLPEDDEDNDNPGMYKYRGYGDLRAIWTPNRSTFTAMLNPATEGTNFELTWSHPINRVFRVYAAYYDGTGESLIDYDVDLRRFSLGVSLNDFLTRY